MTVYTKIKCETKTIYRSIKTGERYETKDAFLEMISLLKKK